VDYLKINNVIGKENEVLVDGLRAFDNKLQCEHRRYVHGLIKKLKDGQDEKQRSLSKPWRKY
jgi:hypothetical protein